MNEITTILAGAMTKEQIVEMLQQAINDWNETPSKDNFKGICAIALLTIKNDTIDEFGGGLEGIDKVNSEMEENKRKINFFDTNIN